MFRDNGPLFKNLSVSQAPNKPDCVNVCFEMDMQESSDSSVIKANITFLMDKNRNILKDGDNYVFKCDIGNGNPVPAQQVINKYLQHKADLLAVANKTKTEEDVSDLNLLYQDSIFFSKIEKILDSDAFVNQSKDIASQLASPVALADPAVHKPIDFETPKLLGTTGEFKDVINTFTTNCNEGYRRISVGFGWGWHAQNATWYNKAFKRKDSMGLDIESSADGSFSVKNREDKPSIVFKMTPDGTVTYTAFNSKDETDKHSGWAARVYPRLAQTVVAFQMARLGNFVIDADALDPIKNPKGTCELALFAKGPDSKRVEDLMCEEVKYLLRAQIYERKAIEKIEAEVKKLEAMAPRTARNAEIAKKKAKILEKEKRFTGLYGPKAKKNLELMLDHKFDIKVGNRYLDVKTMKFERKSPREKSIEGRQDFSAVQNEPDDSSISLSQSTIPRSSSVNSQDSLVLSSRTASVHSSHDSIDYSVNESAGSVRSSIRSRP